MLSPISPSAPFTLSIQVRNECELSKYKTDLVFLFYLLIGTSDSK